MPSVSSFLIDFLMFGLRQAKACLFGGALLAGIIATHFIWDEAWPVYRYDALFVYAFLIQGLFLALKLETWKEARLILVFHIVGTIMEIFKTAVGSWIYPEPALIKLGGVPLFSGFMYSAVGSYMARVWRIFDFKFERYPSKQLTAWLCLGIYLNFFTHHYIWDMRYLLLAGVLYLYGRTTIYFKPRNSYYHMPMLLGFFLVSFFIWLAENIGTFGNIWVYPNQIDKWHMVSPEKMGSWFLLMIISFVLVSFLHEAGSDTQKK